MTPDFIQCIETCALDLVRTRSGLVWCCVSKDVRSKGELRATSRSTARIALRAAELWHATQTYVKDLPVLDCTVRHMNNIHSPPPLPSILLILFH